MPAITCKTDGRQRFNESPAGENLQRGFLFTSNADQQWLPCIAFSVQLAADPTSFAAPRTVLQAAMPRHALIRTSAASF
jgi:hypothetical protein